MRIFHIPLLSLAATVLATSVMAAPTVPTGVFYFPSGRSIDPPTLQSPNVDGVVVGAAWSDLEPSEGNYVFNTAAQGQSLDYMLSLVQAVKKPIRLAIITGGPGVSAGGAKPNWLITKINNDSYAGGKTFTYVVDPNACTTATIPVFWEPTLLSKHALLAQAVANHIAANTAQNKLVQVVFVAYANAETNDWNLGDTSPNADCTGTSPQSRWQQAVQNSGYTTMADALISAGNSTFNAYNTAFPNKVLTTSIGRLQNNVLNPNGANVYGRNISETVVNTAASSWPGHIAAQKNNLNGLGVTAAPGIVNGVPSAWNDLYRLNVPHAAQMVWHAYADEDCSSKPDPYYAQRMVGAGQSCMDSTQMLYNAVNTGRTYSTQWQEIYELDIQNLGSTNGDPHIPAGVPRDVITYAHTHLP